MNSNNETYQRNLESTSIGDSVVTIHSALISHYKDLKCNQGGDI